MDLQRYYPTHHYPEPTQPDSWGRVAKYWGVAIWSLLISAMVVWWG